MKPALVASMILALSLASIGCNRKTGPSPEFARAHASFTKLYGQKLDEAYLDPRIDPIEQDLLKVPESSVDAAEAKALLTRITENRARMQKAIDDRRVASEAALKPVDNVPPTPPAPVEVDAGVAEAPDAGPRQPVGGMSRAEFERDYLGCFEQGDSIEIQGRGLRESFRLKDITNCRERHPGYDRLLVLMEGTSVLGTVPKTSLFTAYADGGAVPPTPPTPAAPDAGS